MRKIKICIMLIVSILYIIFFLIEMCLRMLIYIIGKAIFKKEYDKILCDKDTLFVTDILFWIDNTFKIYG